MTNIIIMLVLLTGPYLTVRAVSIISDRELDATPAAAWGAGLLFVFTGIGHFVQTEQLSWMLPDWVPYRTLLVYATGVLEFVIAAGFLFKKTRWLTGAIAIVVLIAFFPANIYAALNYIPMSGNEWGPAYLLIRGLVQAGIIFWIYWFVVKRLADSFKATSARGAV